MTERFYPSIVTTAGDQLPNIKLADQLGIRNICVFITGINDPKEKQAFLEALGRSNICWVPLVHLRTDSTPSDVEFFINRFNTKLFNVHPSYNGQRINPALEDYKDKICLENVEVPFDEVMINKWGGICADFAHLEAAKIRMETKIGDLTRKDNYLDTLSLVDKDSLNPRVKVAHISTIADSYSLENGGDGYSCHILKKGTSFDYLAKYRYLFPPIMALELENSLKEQQEIAAMLENKYPIEGSPTHKASETEGGEILWQNSQTM